ncbi:MAG: UDP-N-acetylmuramoyl-tripeptide--D-alanyl-D-alanine ligase [Pseudomonadota bacterium]|nr:UDP-N-acetylmuramoyl-tripeptide--D-alanyl-D-alanine ligase [Pseudomonadota bacterium]
MTWLRLSELAGMAGGRLMGDDAPVTSVSTDTRRLEAGQLFVALGGPNFDAHALIEAGAAGQAAGVLVGRRLSASLPQIVVDDTLEGLTRMAGAWRRRFAARVVALTGSNGKTTVKEMTAAILRQAGAVLATRGNLNNHIGVPLTLLSVRPDHRFAVVEMGANHPGEIRVLTMIAAPDAALVNNAGPAHLEGFGDLEGVARGKGEIFSGLTAGGTAVINADDPFYPYWMDLTRRRETITFGFASGADVRGAWISGAPLSVSTPSGAFEIDLPLEGRHNALNALAATALSLSAGATTDQIVLGLARVRPVGGRLNTRAGVAGAEIIDDTYNANPASLAAALDVVSNLGGETWLVLGDMGELGAEAAGLHERAGELARRAGVTRLYAVGPLSRGAASSFGAGARHFDDTQALAASVAPDLRSGIRVLVKGSRAMHLERLVAVLTRAGTGDESRQGAEDAA